MKPEKNDATLTKNQPAADKDDYREPTKEEILEDIRTGLRQVLAGEEGMPALEAIEALEKRIYGDAANG